MSKIAIVSNENGFHARPVGSLVKIVRTFKKSGTTITIAKGDTVVRADSITKLMTLSLVKGSEVTVNAEGPEAEKAINVVATFISEFDETNYDEVEFLAKNDIQID